MGSALVAVDTPIIRRLIEDERSVIAEMSLPNPSRPTELLFREFGRAAGQTWPIFAHRPLLVFA
jgi:hypothetical protein